MKLSTVLLFSIPRAIFFVFSLWSGYGNTMPHITHSSRIHACRIDRRPYFVPDPQPTHHTFMAEHNVYRVIQAVTAHPNLWDYVIRWGKRAHSSREERKQWNIWKWSTERQQHTDETADEYCRQVCANVLFTVNCSEICGRAYTEMLFTVWLYSDCERASEMDKENMQRKNSIHHLACAQHSRLSDRYKLLHFFCLSSFAWYFRTVRPTRNQIQSDHHFTTNRIIWLLHVLECDGVDMRIYTSFPNRFVF